MTIIRYSDNLKNMTQTMVSTATIRQRGQLTLPDKLRDELVWLKEGAVVEIETGEDEVRIKPYVGRVRRGSPDWEKLWANIRLTRGFKSKGKPASASQFIIEDRQRH